MVAAAIALTPAAGTLRQVSAIPDRPAAEPPRLREVLAALEGLYPAWTAQPWDAVGLVCGDPDEPVQRILLAVDPTEAVVGEALEWGAQLVVAHHPLMLRGVHGVPATTAKGRLVHRLVRGGCALVTAHTNADVASPGVSDALARVLGLGDLTPLVPGPAAPLDSVVVHVPTPDADRLVGALSAAGAGLLGAYSRSAFTSTGIGTFLPGPGAAPAVGEVGREERVAETRVQMVLARRDRAAVVRALRAAHPYEQPAFELLALVDDPTAPMGLGRVGELGTATTLERFAQHVAAVLPPTAQGVRVAGDLAAPVRRVAVCGGAGDDLFAAVRASGADAYVAADLRHHPAVEAREHGLGAPPYIVDVAHWASEWPWLAGCASRLGSALAARAQQDGGADAGASAPSTVELRVSTTRTDPWTAHVPSRGSTP